MRTDSTDFSTSSTPCASVVGGGEVCMEVVEGGKLRR